MRVIFSGGGTGGHLYPALAIARALQALHPEVRPHFVGARRGIERDVLPGAGFPFTLLDLHPMYRAAPWRNWRTIVGLASGWRTMSRLAAEDPPRLIVATGGYASAAALTWARVSRVPYVIQEQNSFPGRTVTFFAAGARELYLGFPEAAPLLPASARPRAIDTGNPVEPPHPLVGSRADALRAWGFGEDVRTVVLAFGGSQGSVALNTLVDDWVARGLPPGVGLIWGTGREHIGKHASRASARVVVRPYLSPIAEAYAVSDFAIARAGAMTTAELCAWGIPMLLIPLPTAAADHQTANAKALAVAGAARWLPQAQATAASLDEVVRPLLSNRALLEPLASAARRRGRPDASARIATRIAALLGEGNAVRSASP